MTSWRRRRARYSSVGGDVEAKEVARPGRMPPGAETQVLVVYGAPDAERACVAAGRNVRGNAHSLGLLDDLFGLPGLGAMSGIAENEVVLESASRSVEVDRGRIVAVHAPARLPVVGELELAIAEARLVVADALEQGAEAPVEGRRGREAV